MKEKLTISHVTPEGAIVEMIYRPEDDHTGFAVFRKGMEVEYTDEVETDFGTLVPLPPDNSLLKSKVILFPSKAEELGTEAELVGDVQAFVHKYLQVGEVFEQVATYYALFTWVYDRFNELPYLRAIGDYGTGKSRFLKVVGALCYKPMFANGAITSAPVFRIMEECHGTLVLNEADFKMSDAWSDITKILNNGFETGFPVLRCEPQGKGKDFKVRPFDVFGPKMLAARERFGDNALESRFISEEMENKDIRKDIPINLPDSFWEEACGLRNRLLMWRFRNYHTTSLDASLAVPGIEPRLNQIALPLRSIIGDSRVRDEIGSLVQRMNTEILKDRGMSKEADIVEVVIRLQQISLRAEPAVKEIAEAYNEGKSEKEQITPRKAGSILKNKLGLKTEKGRDGFFLSQENLDKISRLQKKYGILDAELPERSQPS